jgi:hypothetical protein
MATMPRGVSHFVEILFNIWAIDAADMTSGDHSTV